MELRFSLCPALAFFTASLVNLARNAHIAARDGRVPMGQLTVTCVSLDIRSPETYINANSVRSSPAPPAMLNTATSAIRAWYMPPSSTGGGNRPPQLMAHTIAALKGLAPICFDRCKPKLTHL
jgi:hypothetical protein